MPYEFIMALPVLLHDLTKVFGETRAVDGISCTIEGGELFFLLGPSGCGKTTLLRCIAGFHEPDSGTVHIGERDVTNLPPYERDAGMVFQSYALWPHMTVSQNVAFGLDMRKVGSKEKKQRVNEALEMVQMTDRATFKPNQLSGGQQQRVALARALVIRPTCLLLDEPLSNLDAKLRLEMRTEIRRICKQAGLTGIYVTHDQKEALSIADRIAILNGGKIQHCGPPEEVYLRPKNKFVADFIGETNFIEGTVTDSATVETAMGILTPEECRFNAGSKITVSLRPETINFEEPPIGCPNVFDGSVHDTIYLGEVAQHKVTIKGLGDNTQTQLKAFDLNPRIVARDTASQAKVWVHARDVILLAE